jgi:two-component system sensor histidine kinase RegB
MAGRSGQPVGELPIEIPLPSVADAATARLSAAERARVVVAADNIRVVWPTDVVARALENLLRNGLQASTAGDPVRLVMCRDDAARIRIDIIDRGSGVAPGDLARVGEPFFTTKGAHGGTGLGLFVARTSFEQLGGSLTIAPGATGGTMVTVTLPENVIEHDSARA